MQDRSPPTRRNLLQRTAGPYIRVIHVVSRSRCEWGATGTGRRRRWALLMLNPSLATSTAATGLALVTTCRLICGLAAAGGDKTAMDRRKRIEAKMTPIQIEQSEALLTSWRPRTAN